MDVVKPYDYIEALLITFLVVGRCPVNNLSNMCDCIWLSCPYYTSRIGFKNCFFPSLNFFLSEQAI